MKKASALWGGTALLIELVILILALVRGDWMIPLLLAVFAGWSLWLIFTQLLPVWKNNRAYRKKEQELREQPVDGSNNLESDGELSKMLLQHVNYRILTILKAAYPNVQWEWTMEDPAASVFTKSLIMTLRTSRWTGGQISAVIWSRLSQLCQTAVLHPHPDNRSLTPAYGMSCGDGRCWMR